MLMVFMETVKRSVVASKVNPTVNYVLQLIVMYQSWLIKYNKRTSLMQDVSNVGHYGCAGMREYMRTLCTFCSIIAVNVKITLKNKVR